MAATKSTLPSHPSGKQALPRFMLEQPGRQPPDLEALRRQLHQEVDLVVDALKGVDGALLQGHEHLAALSKGARWELGIAWEERRWGLESSPVAYRVKAAGSKGLRVVQGLRKVYRRLAEALPIKGLGWYRSTHPAIHPKVPQAQKEVLLLVQLMLEERERLAGTVESWRKSVSLFRRHHQSSLEGATQAMSRSFTKFQLVGALTEAFAATLAERAGRVAAENTEDFAKRWGKHVP